MATIMAIITAIPIVDRWVQQFIAFYVNARIDSMAKENKDSLAYAIANHDQRKIEHAMGSKLEGKPSGVDGSIIVDSIAGVSDVKQK